MAAFTSSSNTSATEQALIISAVQDVLIREAKLLPTVSDYSSFVEPGSKSISVPRVSSFFSGPAALNVDGDTATAFQTANLAVDTIALDQWLNIPWTIPDRISMQNKVNLEAMSIELAGKQMANLIDDKIITELKLVSTTSPDHYLQLTGTSNLVLTLADIANARMLLNKQNVSQSDRFLVIAPEQEKAMLALSNFIKANEYGDRQALLNGEIGRVFGFTVMVHNGLNADDMLAYHKSHVGVAFQKSPSFEKQRGDVRLSRDEYAITMGAGFERLDGGKRGVWYDDAGA